MSEGRRVLAFGTFDPLHAGHHDFFRQAARLGDSLTVVVASDEAVRRLKQREPTQTESVRIAAIRQLPGIDTVVLGEANPEEYRLLRQLNFDVLALGYDQAPDDATVKTLLHDIGKPDVRVVRLTAYRPQEFKSSRLRNGKTLQSTGIFDLHLHSNYSDGDEVVATVVAEVARRGVAGFSLTDHNGVWGVDEAARLAAGFGLRFIEGIEVSARLFEVDIHILGYSPAFERDGLHEGLSSTRQGYAERMREMIGRCEAAGFPDITWDDVVRRRHNQDSPVYVSHDLRSLLREKYGLSFEEVRRLTTTGGACHVPYGDWALTGSAAVELIHRAKGVAVLAHPGAIEADAGRETLQRIADHLVAAQLDGIEIYHPFVSEQLVTWLTEYADRQSLLVTGGSDWHGAGQFPESHVRFGSIGGTAAHFEALLNAANA